MAVRQQDFFRVGVLPPLLLFAACPAARPGLRARRRGRATASCRRWSPGSPGTRDACRRLRTGPRRAGGTPPGGRRRARPVASRRSATPAHSKRAGSPAPYRLISATPEEKSTTVVGASPALTRVDDRVQHPVQLVLDQPALGHRLGLPGQQQRARQQRLAELGQQRLHHTGGRGSARRRCASWGASADAAPRCGRQDEGVGPRRGRLDRPEHRVVDVHQLASWAKSRQTRVKWCLSSRCRIARIRSSPARLPSWMPSA